MSLARIVGVWLLLAVLMSANGVFREAALRPALGPTTAGVLSVVLGITIILLVTRHFFHPLAGQPAAQLAAVSALLVALTVTFEFLLGRYVDRKSWADLAADYAIWRGRLWPVVLLVIALTPFLWGKWWAGPARAAAAAGPGAASGA